MSRSNDPGHYFQTTDALATSERKAAKSKNKHGDPIKLSSKLLAAVGDPFSQHAVYVAEAVGDIKHVDLESRKITKIFDQSAAPLTCLAICPKTKTLFAGSWDKTIYAIPLNREGSIQKISGHTDFLKCLLVTSLNGSPIIVSGSADATIIFWNLSPEEFGTQLHKLKGHTKALSDLTIDPQSLPSDSVEPKEDFTLFTASSDREIRQWYISRETAYELPTSLEKPIRAHDTSVYKLHWDSEGDLWTASADKTAKHLVRSRDWEADTTLQHPDFVRDVVAFENLGLVVTACRDEEVRVWEIASGKLVCSYSGHFEEVTGLVALGERKVASVSIDGTVRQWSLERKEMEKFREERAREKAGNGEKEEDKEGSGSMLTAEEEAELAELMSDDE